jgi:hypothetical protein
VQLLAQFLETPLFGVALPVAVEPEQVGLVGFAEFLQLRAMKG